MECWVALRRTRWALTGLPARRFGADAADDFPAARFPAFFAGIGRMDDFGALARDPRARRLRFSSAKRLALPVG
jgi:hypothetical protein